MITESLKSAASVPNPPVGKVTLFVDLDGKHKMKMPDGSVSDIGGSSSGAIYIASDRLAAIALRDAGQLQAGAYYWLEDVSVLIQALSASTFAPTAKHLKSTASQSLTYGMLYTDMLGQQSQISSILISDKHGILNTECLIEPVTINTSELEAGAVAIAAAINANVNCGWTATAIKHAVVLKNNAVGVQFNSGSVVATTDGKATFDFASVSEGRESTARWYDVVYDPNTITYMAGVDPVSLPGFFSEIYDPEYNVRVNTTKNMFLQEGLYFIESFPFGSPRFKNCHLKNIQAMDTTYVFGNANISIISDRAMFINTIIDSTLVINAPDAMIQKTLFINGSQIIVDLPGSGFTDVVFDSSQIVGTVKNSGFQNIVFSATNSRFDVDNFEFYDHVMSEMRVSYYHDTLRGSVSVYKTINMGGNDSCELGVVPNNVLIHEVISYGENLTANLVELLLYTDKDNDLVQSSEFATNYSSAFKSISNSVIIQKPNTLAKIILRGLSGDLTQGMLSITFNYIKHS